MKISHTMNLSDLAERTGDATLEEYKLEHIRMRLCSMGWKDTSEVPDVSWLNILNEVSEPMPVYSVEEDSETGEWLEDPVMTSETSTLLDWCNREDTDYERFSHYEHETENGESETRLIRSTFAS
jgi:hypothetical protein